MSENAKQECKINSTHGCPSNLTCMCLGEGRGGPASVHKALIFPRVHPIFIVFACFSKTFESGFVVLLKTIHWLHPFKTSESFCLCAEQYPTMGVG